MGCIIYVSEPQKLCRQAWLPRHSVSGPDRVWTPFERCIWTGVEEVIRGCYWTWGSATAVTCYHLTRPHSFMWRGRRQVLWRGMSWQSLDVMTLRPASKCTCRKTQKVRVLLPWQYSPFAHRLTGQQGSRPQKQPEQTRNMFARSLCIVSSRS